MPPPDATLTDPPDGSIVSGTITLKATAVDHSGSGIWFVAFYYDSTTYIDADFLAPYQMTFDTTTLPDGDHVFAARAEDNTSAIGPYDTVTLNVHNAPPPPVNVGADPGENSLSVHWAPTIYGATNYKVYRQLQAGRGFVWELVATVSGSTFGYLDTGLVNGQSYTYYVAALDADGNESYPSVWATGAPFTPPPALTGFAQTLYDELEPLQYADQGFGYPLAHYCAAVAKPFDELWDYVVTPDTPWSTVVDLDVTPAKFVDWLGRFKGVAIARGSLSDADKREQIRHAAGFDRGTITAMIAAAKLGLTGTKHLTVEERVGGSAWQIRFTVYTSEVATSAQAIIDAVLAQKPGGIVFTLVVAASETWNEAGATTWNSAPGGMTWNTATTGL